MPRAVYSNCYIPLSLGLLSFCLFGCPQSTFSDLPSAPQVKQTVNPAQQPQFLEIAASAGLANRTVKLEVARTPEQQAKGMMWRTQQLPDDRGMVFPFGSLRPLSFWMKNCFVPLDMVFIANGRVVAIETAPPCTQDPCPSYPKTPVLGDTVIELRAGWAQKYGLRVGDRVEVAYNF